MWCMLYLPDMIVHFTFRLKQIYSTFHTKYKYSWGTCLFRLQSTCCRDAFIEWFTLYSIHVSVYEIMSGYITDVVYLSVYTIYVICMSVYIGVWSMCF